MANSTNLHYVLVMGLLGKLGFKSLPTLREHLNNPKYVDANKHVYFKLSLDTRYKLKIAEKGFIKG